MTTAILIFLISASTTQADQSFQNDVIRIQKNQSGIDQMISQMGRSVGFDPVQGANMPTQAANTDSPLFRIHTNLTAQRIHAGQILFGELVNRLVVGVDGSPVLIDLDVAQGGLSGLRLMGTAKQSATEGRIAIELTRLLLRTGSSVSIQATALDDDGAFGLTAQVLSDKTLAIAGSMATSFISGLTTAQQTQTSSAYGFNQVQPSSRNGILQGVAQTAADQSKRFIEEATKEKPVLILDARTSVSVLIQEDVRW